MSSSSSFLQVVARIIFAKEWNNRVEQRCGSLRARLLTFILTGYTSKLMNDLLSLFFSAVSEYFLICFRVYRKKLGSHFSVYTLQSRSHMKTTSDSKSSNCEHKKYFQYEIGERSTKNSAILHRVLYVSFFRKPKKYTYSTLCKMADFQVDRSPISY